jgi:hypothetical protein
VPVNGCDVAAGGLDARPIVAEAEVGAAKKGIVM